MTHVKAMSYNIRYNNVADGQNAWPHRKHRVAQLIKKHKPDCIGLQEVLIEQLEYLKSKLTAYDYLGVGRDDGKQAGEFSPIFYLKDSFERLESGTFWLSQTPKQAGSVGWDASLPRIASWAKFVHKPTTTPFFHLNTHFDHIGQEARQQSAKLILKHLRAKVKDEATVVTGDFNLEPNSPAYQTLTTSLQDSFKMAQEHDDSNTTCLGFKVGQSKGVRIDYIFCTDKLKVKSYQTLTESQGGYYPSDHVPVLVNMTF